MYLMLESSLKYPEALHSKGLRGAKNSFIKFQNLSLKFKKPKIFTGLNTEPKRFSSY